MRRTWLFAALALTAVAACDVRSGEDTEAAGAAAELPEVIETPEAVETPGVETVDSAMSEAAPDTTAEAPAGDTTAEAGGAGAGHDANGDAASGP